MTRAALTTAALRLHAAERYTRRSPHWLAQLPGALSVFCPDPTIPGIVESIPIWKQGANDTNYLYSTAAAFHAGQTGGKLTVEFWWRKGMTANSGTPIRAFISMGKGATAAQHQFVIGCQDNSYYNDIDAPSASGYLYATDQIVFGGYNSTDANWFWGRWNFQYSGSGASNGAHHNQAPWCHCVWVYDGSQADNATRLKLYVNGSLQTIGAYQNTVPATLSTQAGAELRIGQSRNVAYANGDVYTHYAKGQSALHSSECAYGPMRFWSTALDATTIAGLYNAGRPRMHSALTTAEKTGLIAAYDWRGTNGTQDESGAGLTLTASGAQTIGNAVLSVADLVDGALWLPRWSSVLTSYEINAGAKTTALIGLATADAENFGASPELETANNQYVIHCRGQQYLSRPLPDAWAKHVEGFTAYSCLALDAVLTVDGSAELFGYMAGSRTQTADYMAHPFTGLVTGNRKWSNRARNDGTVAQSSGVPNQQDLGAATIAVNSAYHVVAVTDPGGNYAWTVRDNGVAETMTKQGGGPAHCYTGYNDMPTSDYHRLCLHGFLQGGTYSGGSRAHYGIHAFYAPAPAAEITAQIETYLRTLYGV